VAAAGFPLYSLYKDCPCTPMSLCTGAVFSEPGKPGVFSDEVATCINAMHRQYESATWRQHIVVS
jgi:hypothetical protein